MDMDTEAGSEKRRVGGDLVIPVAALLFTLYYFSTIVDSPWTAQVSAYFVGSVLILLSLAFIVRSVAVVRRGEAYWSLQDLVAPLDFLPKRLVLLALTLGYIFAIEWGGFTITTFVFMAAAMLLLTGGLRKGLILGLSGVVSVGGYLLFVVAFETRFPRGPFEQLAERLF
jgi:hypothetical protein